MVVRFFALDTEGRTERTLGYGMNFPENGLKDGKYRTREMTNSGIEYFKNLFPLYKEYANDSVTFTSYVGCEIIKFVDEDFKSSKTPKTMNESTNILSRMAAIKPEALDYTYEEILEIVVPEIENSITEFLNETPDEHARSIQTWVENIDIFRVNDEYIERLKNDFTNNGWKDVEVEFQSSRCGILDTIYIALNFPRNVIEVEK